MIATDDLSTPSVAIGHVYVVVQCGLKDSVIVEFIDIGCCFVEQLVETAVCITVTGLLIIYSTVCCKDMWYIVSSSKCLCSL